MRLDTLKWGDMWTEWKVDAAQLVGMWGCYLAGEVEEGEVAGSLAGSHQTNQGANHEANHGANHVANQGAVASSIVGAVGVVSMAGMAGYEQPNAYPAPQVTWWAEPLQGVILNVQVYPGYEGAGGGGDPRQQQWVPYQVFDHSISILHVTHYA